MGLIRIVYVPTPDRRGPDLTRMGKVEDHPDEVARVMVADGSAVWASDEEAERYRAETADTQTDTDAAGPDDTTDGGEAGGDDLAGLTKAQLLGRVPEGVTVPAGATKADLIGLIRGAAA